MLISVESFDNVAILIAKLPSVVETEASLIGDVVSTNGFFTACEASDLLMVASNEEHGRYCFDIYIVYQKGGL